ncbi:MAG: hypothetical protein NVS3B14_15780 [Ktedonobacteraceae bacterium]
MNSPFNPLASPPEMPTRLFVSSPRQRFARLRSWLRSRSGRIIIPLVALLLGIMIGLVSLILYGLSGDRQVAGLQAPGKGDITVELDRAFITDIVSMNIGASGMPGTVKNVQVDLASGDLVTINADDEFSLLGFGVTKHFTIVVQPYVTNCLLQTRIVHVELSGIPVTGFVQLFTSNLNQELLKKPTGLPQGFTYCTTGVHTQPSGLFITYSATPIRS